MDFAGAVKRGKLVVQKSRAQHEPVGGEMRFSDHTRRAIFERGSQHEQSLSVEARTSNVSFRLEK
jgi:hypothetical protein